MTPDDGVGLAVFGLALAGGGWLLGRPAARLLEGEQSWLTRLLGPVERLIYRLCHIDPRREMDWKEYTRSLLMLAAAGTFLLYALQRFQGYLPGNPRELGPVGPWLAFNTAASFVTNTNWQSYAGEVTLSHAVTLLGLTVQNFLSAATGIAVLLALVRGIVRRETGTLGNYWADMVRGTLYVLLPLSLVFSLFLVSQGVVQTFSGGVEVPLLEPVTGAGGQAVASQTIPLGPAASQVAIKQLGTNGGGYFNVNSAHPLENPTPLSNFFETLALLLIPAVLCFSFGHWVKDLRQGWALFAAMLVLLAMFTGLAVWQETGASPGLASLGVDQSPGPGKSAGNLEGKEVRFGAVPSALWLGATTAASNGSVNSMHSSAGPLSGMAAIFLMGLGEVAFGGVGSGLYGMLMFVFVAVLMAGLMVGRTPEYLGKKIQSYETKLAVLVILIPPILCLAGTALACVTPRALASLSHRGPHGFSEMLYAFTSAANNNGSAFAGLTADTPFWNTALGLAMLAGRFLLIVPVLAIAGALARKKFIPPSAGTLPTHTPLFVTLLVGVVLIVGALNFLPALVLGPIVEHLQWIQPVR